MDRTYSWVASQPRLFKVSQSCTRLSVIVTKSSTTCAFTTVKPPHLWVLGPKSSPLYWPRAKKIGLKVLTITKDRVQSMWQWSGTFMVTTFNEWARNDGLKMSVGGSMLRTFMKLMATMVVRSLSCSLKISWEDEQDIGLLVAIYELDSSIRSCEEYSLICTCELEGFAMLKWFKWNLTGGRLFGSSQEKRAW